MPFYEHVVIARPDISGQQAEALLEEMKGILAENGGRFPRPNIGACAISPIAFASIAKATMAS